MAKAEKPDYELIHQMLVDGETYRNVAKKFGMSLTTLYDYINKPEHSTRTREALTFSADTFYDLAEEVLREIPNNATQGQITRQRELAQYFMKKAGKRNPKSYGDKVDVTSDGKAIAQPPIQWISATNESTE